MRRHCVVLIIALAVFAVRGQCQGQPLKLSRTLTLPAEVKGHFDHFGIDLKGQRLFATPEDYKAVLAYDLKTGKLVHTINGIGRPHAVLYREDLNRIYVTDGTAGELKVYDGKTYSLMASVKLLEDADSIGYDPATKYLYIDNGGGDAHQTYSILSVVDTAAGKKLADIKIDGETIEAMALEKSSPKIYVNVRSKNEVAVVDREKREVVATWRVTQCKDNVAMALDEERHRLFLGCRSGQIVIFDTQAGKELTALPITKGVDDMVFDRESERLYAAGDGAVDVYEQTSADNYKLLGKVQTGPVGKTALLAPQLKQYFVAVPRNGSKNADILVFEVQ